MITRPSVMVSRQIDTLQNCCSANSCPDYSLNTDFLHIRFVPQWADLLNFIEDQTYEHDCNHTLRYTKKFCQVNNLDFQRIKDILSSLVVVGNHDICDCVITEEEDRFMNPSQSIDENPELELRLFWTNLFGHLAQRMKASPDPSMPKGYMFQCTNSFKYTKEFCEQHGLNTDEILKILRKANAFFCDCEVMTNSTQYFEDDAVIGTEPSINLDEMKNPNFSFYDIDPDRLRAFRDMR